MAFTEVYVDPSIAADSGAGTIGDPYGDLEYAIEQTTFDTTNGTRFNVKAGTTEFLADNLHTALTDVVTTPSYIAGMGAGSPLLIQGYTATAGDGGRASIQNASGVAICDNANDIDYTHFIDIDFIINNQGGSVPLRFDNVCHVRRCSFTSIGTNGTSLIINGDIGNVVSECYFNVDTTGSVIDFDGSSSMIKDSYIRNANSGGEGVDLNAGAVIQNCILVVQWSSQFGIGLRDYCVALNNSIYKEGATGGIGPGIALIGNEQTCDNNLIVGFDGVGGEGIGSTLHTKAFSVRGNAVYNCTTAYDYGDAGIDEDNEILTTSPFNDAANGDFSPVDTGNVREGALPNIIGGGLV